MLKILEREKWQEEVLRTRALDVNEESFFVDIISSFSSGKPVYFLYQKNDKTIFSFIAFISGKKIFHPFHFFYSAFWKHHDLSDAQYCEYLDGFVKDLLAKYDSIEIKLPTNFSDARPFIWNNFSINNCYTYIKDLKYLDYHITTKKNIRKASRLGFTCLKEQVDEASLFLNLKVFSHLKVYGKKKINDIGKLMSMLSEVGYLKSFNCYKDDELVASNLILLDENLKTAYTILLNRTSRFNKDDVHSLLHDFFFNSLKSDGYLFVDLMGGDMKNISAFKSRFNAKLQPHFLVTYSRKQALIKDSANRIKNLAKSVLKNFN